MDAVAGISFMVFECTAVKLRRVNERESLAVKAGDIPARSTPFGHTNVSARGNTNT